MKYKGSIKAAGKRPNFWGKAEKKLSESFKSMIYDQYYSYDTLHIYCDCSMDIQNNIMSVACSYIQGGSVTVDSNLIYPPTDCVGKNIYGELQAVMFVLMHFEKQLSKFNKNIVIYSDIDHIIDILNLESTFKRVTSLQTLQTDLIRLFERKQSEFPQINISLRYLPIELRAYNPFTKSAHNAARKLLQKEVKKCF